MLCEVAVLVRLVGGLVMGIYDGALNSTSHQNRRICAVISADESSILGCFTFANIFVRHN